mmetsp:Transcript_41369/g.63058  ORF Transcript_41369/g.63058 Transcript_41369/m.63058 type:complete len:216 (-) Transcript_41369:3213-3860(-)
MVVLYFKGSYIRIRNYYVYITVVLFKLGFDITDSSRDGEAPREDAVGSVYYLLAGFSEGWVSLNYLGVLVNTTFIFDDPFHFNFIGRLMICREQEQLLATVSRHDSSAVSSVGTVAHVVNDEDDNGAATGPIDFTSFLFLAFSEFNEEAFGFSETVAEGLDRILREIIILYNELMEVVPKEISTDCSSMPIINSEERALRPLLVLIVLRLRLHDI